MPEPPSAFPNSGAEEMLFQNPYGGFEKTSGAFVITDVLSPRPWINVMSNDRYGLVLSQAGGGFSWADNCQLFRLNRWEQDLVKDQYGRFLYVLDLDAPEQLWSTTYQPTRHRAETDSVRHDLGCTTFNRRFAELETEHTIFVPSEGCEEVWLVRIRNLSDRPRRLRLAGYLEWHLGGIGDWHREFHRLFMESSGRGNTLVAWKHPGLKENVRERPVATPYAYMGWNGVEVVRWCTDKQTWLGRCGSEASPEGIYTLPQESETPRWDDPIAASVAEIALGPGEVKEFTVVIGAASNFEECEAAVQRYSFAASESCLIETLANWRKRCVSPLPLTGDEAIDLMANTWLPYQAIAGRLWAKCAYYQQGGAYGYRDQLQDSLMLLETEPSATLKQLGKHAEAMYEDGGVRHWWHPGTDIFVESKHSDTCLWLAYGVLAYVDATADYACLERPYGFLNRKSQDVESTGSLFDHCLRGIDRTLGRLSMRGLPLIESGDWNDGLSHVGLEGRGESVWLAMFLFDILNRWRPHLEKLGRQDLDGRFQQACANLKDSVHAHAWDGEWYMAGTRDDGKPFGSASCTEGRIFLNPQTWAVISGIAPPERVSKAMRAVRDQLLTPYGALLLQPAYREVDPYIGYISRYAPGLRENGGVYSHASTWAIQAFAMMGDKETAKKLYLGMLPPLRAQAEAELYAAEPYVMPGNIDGPDSPYAGRAGWTWYTGSAAWMRRVIKYLN